MEEIQRFDPLDKNTICTIVKSQRIRRKHRIWLYDKDQKVAHLHKIKIEESLKRFNAVGYPGRFTQPAYESEFYKEIRIVEDTYLSWYCLSGRLRVNLNGKELDITEKTVRLVAGAYQIKLSLDFTDTLPAIQIQSNDEELLHKWQVRIDKGTYCLAAESPCYENILNPLIKPSIIALCPPQKIEKRVEGWLVDFGYYELGRVKAQVKGEGKARLILAQSRQEVLNREKKYFEQKQSTWKRIDGEATIFSSRQAGRYAFLIVKGEIALDKIEFIMEVTEVTYKGQFSSSYEVENKIFKAGAATVHSCMHDFILDAIYRDALPWALDGVSSIVASNALFLEQEVSRNTIISQLLPVNADEQDLGVTYLDFQLYTLLGFEIDYFYYGDRSFIEQHKSRIYHTALLYLKCLKKDIQGFLSVQAIGFGSFWPDWSTGFPIHLDIKGTPAYVQIILCHVLEGVGNLAKEFRDLETEKLFHTTALQLREQIKRLLIDEKTGLIYNGYTKEGKLDRRFSCYAQVFGVLYDFIGEENYGKVTRFLMDDHNRHNSVSINYFWEMLSLAKMGKRQAALESLEHILTPILKCGDGRFYEDIRRDGKKTYDFYGRPYGKSLCHAILGAAGVVGELFARTGLSPVWGKYATFEYRAEKSKVEDLRVVLPIKDGQIIYREQEGRVVFYIEGSCTILLKNTTTQTGERILFKTGEYELQLGGK